MGKAKTSAYNKSIMHKVYNVQHAGDPTHSHLLKEDVMHYLNMGLVELSFCFPKWRTKHLQTNFVCNTRGMVLAQIRKDRSTRLPRPGDAQSEATDRLTQPRKNKKEMHWFTTVHYCAINTRCNGNLCADPLFVCRVREVCMSVYWSLHVRLSKAPRDHFQTCQNRRIWA